MAKSASGKLAQTDPSLLDRSDSTTVPVVVKLDYDAPASYTGEVEGAGGHQPEGHGPGARRPVRRRAGLRRVHRRHRVDVRVRCARPCRRPTVGVSLREVYGGVAVTLPADSIAKVLTLPGVAAVQPDSLQQPLTDSSPGFIGAPTLWDQEGGQANAGKGLIFGSLDTGIWPEHPSFADDGTLGAPPAKADGSPRACDFGDNPLTPDRRPVHVQQQAHRRPALPGDVQPGAGRRGVPRLGP